MVMRMVLIVVMLGACSAPTADGRLTVAASVYPLAEVAERLVGDRGDVVEVTPPGAEPHDVELSSRQIEQVLDAEVLVAIGGGFQPAIEDLAGRHDGHTLLIPAAGEDPHIWLDPRRMGEIASLVAETLTEADPEGAAVYRERAAEYAAAMDALDREYREALSSCRRSVLVVTHAAFGHLAATYGLEQLSLAGLEPEAEPDPARLDEVADTIVERGITTVFTEPGAPSDVAETLARETGARVAVLDPIETLTEAQRRAGADYAAVMRQNLEAIREGLGCA